MPAVMHDKLAASRAELVGTALRHCAVADWFESHPCVWRRHMSLTEAMDVFNRAEAELREVGARALRGSGHRALVLQAAGVADGSEEQSP